MTLTDILIDIQERETGERVPSDVVDQLRELATEFDIEANPRWLLPIFKAVQEGCVVSPPVFFEKEGSDPYSYLGEVEALLGWDSDDQGEYELIKFPRSGWRIYISNEAKSPITGRGGSTYEVTRLPSKL